jgi:CTP synthase (UTP-ammonia lyase)
VIEHCHDFFLQRYDHTFGTVNIVLVGKYVSLKDSYMSVIKSLEHASLRLGKKLNLKVRLSALPTPTKMIVC